MFHRRKSSEQLWSATNKGRNTIATHKPLLLILAPTKGDDAGRKSTIIFIKFLLSVYCNNINANHPYETAFYSLYFLSVINAIVS